MTLDKDAYSSDEEITINTTLTDENNQEINNAVIKHMWMMNYKKCGEKQCLMRKKN